ncbi:hypothetical protein BLNAU_15693 [Blattamonas nauphoetae]|uniref:HECT-type E3 ubiquitin transferase n=1 Tax=Blattamonas nauphoetae TaxID=2049346 RepID=A0ABQ9XDM0_9EUKA|nr:hypothetical protein BLNAU_15693 [Blattamonas nauphoetae]
MLTYLSTSLTTERVQAPSVRLLKTPFSECLEKQRQKFEDALSAIQPLARIGKCKITFPPDANIAKSMVAMYNKTRAELLQPFYVILEGTDAIDLNGIKRWFFTKLVEKINDPKDLGLFTPDGTGKGTLTIPSDPKFKNPTFLQIYKFAGLILGKVMLERLYVPFRFNKFIWKLLQGHPMEQEDLQSLGHGHHDNFEVTLNSYSLIVTAMRSDLHSLVPDHVLRLLSPEELELMVCGKTEIDVVDWKRRTYYTSELSSHPQVISTFWTMVDRAHSTVVINASVFLFCSSSSMGGACQLIHSSATFIKCQFRQNTAPQGSALYALGSRLKCQRNDHGSLSLVGCVLVGFQRVGKNGLSDWTSSPGCPIDIYKGSQLRLHFDVGTVCSFIHKRKVNTIELSYVFSSEKK